MNLRQLLAVAAAATLLVPGAALAGTGTPHAQADAVSIRTLEGPDSSPEIAPVPTTAARAVVAAPAAARGKSARARADARARKAAKRACKGLSKKHVKGTKGTPYSRCIVAASQRRKQVTAEPAEPVVATDPVGAPAV